MSLFYFVEILNHNGEVQIRHKFNDLPIRLGRSYSNDIILDDPHTAAEHAIIELDDHGKLMVRDLGSQNALKLKGKTHSHINLSGDTVVQLGQTSVRVRDSHYVVTAEVSDTRNNRWQGWPLLGSAMAIICLLALSATWLGDISDSKTTEYIMAATSWLGFSALWAGGWAIANRVFGGTANFAWHLFTLSCGLLALTALDYLCAFLSFAFSWEAFTHYNSHLEFALAATMIYYHLRHINIRKRANLKIMCVLISVIGSSFMLMNNYKNTNQYADQLYMHEVLPPALRISRNHSLTEFDQDIQNLKHDIDAEREKALKEKADKNETTKN